MVPPRIIFLPNRLNVRAAVAASSRKLSSKPMAESIRGRLPKLLQSSAGYRGNDGDFSPVCDRRGKVFEKPNVLAIEIYIDEPAKGSGLVAYAGSKTRVFRIQIVEHFLDGRGFDFNRFRAGCELP